MDVLNNSWVVVDKLSPTQAEKLFILLEFVGMSINTGTREYDARYPYIAYVKRSMHVHIKSAYPKLHGYKKIALQKLEKDLKKLISSQIKNK